MSAQPKQSKYSDIISDGGLDPRNKFDAQPEPPFQLTDAGADTNIPLWGLEPKGSGMVTLNQVGMRVNLKDGTRKEWVGLTEGELIDIQNCNRGFWTNAAKIEQLLKDKNT